MEERKGFGTNFGFLMAAVGSAVGLGNIWGFPNKMGASGGFTFLVIYLVLAVLCGFIVMVGELALGRKTRHGAVGAYKALSKKFKWMGWMGILSAFFILFFYCALGGYCIKYTVLNIGDLFHAGFGANALAETAVANGHSLGAEVFGAFMSSPTEAIVYGLIFVAITMIIVLGGIGGGIEKVCSVGMPALFVMLLICIIRACTLEGAVDGLKYMFVPGWAVANGVIEEAPNFLTVLSTAGGQMFFSLSLGMGAMITYGSYLKKQESVQKNAVIIVICDTLVAIMAGMIVMPACYAFLGGETSSGPGLLFLSMQIVFEKMGYVGNIMGFLFYSLVFIAAISSSFSLLEVITSFKVDHNVEQGKAPGRKKYAILAACIIFVFCLPTCLDGLGAGTNGGATIGNPADVLGMHWAEAGDISEFAEGTDYYVKGDDGIYTKLAADEAFVEGETYYLNTARTWNGDWLDFYDMLSEGILMPLGALLMSIMYGWELGPEVVHAEATCEGQKFGAYGWFRICIKYITPLAMLLVLYGQIKEFFF